MKTAYCILTLFCFASCNNLPSKEVSKAYIYERQGLNDGKILLHYRFQSAEQIILDTAVVENAFIPQDSIPVQYDINQPQDSKLLLAAIK